MIYSISKMRLGGGWNADPDADRADADDFRGRIMPKLSNYAQLGRLAFNTSSPTPLLIEREL